MNYTYILLCRDDTLAYYESFRTRGEAMRREWEIKHLTRREKLWLIESQPEQSPSFPGKPA